jgi:hypothetical protein
MVTVETGEGENLGLKKRFCNAPTGRTDGTSSGWVARQLCRVVARDSLVAYSTPTAAFYRAGQRPRTPGTSLGVPTKSRYNIATFHT